MPGCCNPRGCDRMFTPRFARLMAGRYRRRGLGRTARTARTMVDLLPQAELQGATVLEIGDGVGEIQLELLRRGAASATNLELSPAYDAEAARLLAEAGLSDRVQRRIADIAADPSAAPAADVVVLHRVVCCYPDYARLLGVAARHAGRHLVFSHPPRNLLSRAVVATQNLLLRLGGREFRVFAHPPAAMLAVLGRTASARPARTAGRCGGSPWSAARRRAIDGHRPGTVTSDPAPAGRRPASWRHPSFPLRAEEPAARHRPGSRGRSRRGAPR